MDLGGERGLTVGEGGAKAANPAKGPRSPAPRGALKHLHLDAHVRHAAWRDRGLASGTLSRDAGDTTQVRGGGGVAVFGACSLRGRAGEGRVIWRALIAAMPANRAPGAS